MKDAKDLIPWKTTDISVYPYGTELWSMNPSIQLDSDGTWRYVARIVDYAMPGGHTIRSPKAPRAGHQSKNAMVVLDPATWKPIQIFKMHERDGLPRAACANVGFEDMRIFKTDAGGLQGIAASLHLTRDTRPSEGTAQHQPPEQVLLSFDAEYNIVAARPIRGDGWSGPQKNWVPFDHCAEPRFLYSIDKGSMFDHRGRVHGDEALVRPSANARPIPASSVPVVPIDELREARERREREEREEHEARERREREEHEARERREREEYERRTREEHEAHERREREKRDKKHRTRLDRRVVIGGTEAQVVRGGRIARAAPVGSRTGARRSSAARGGNESARVIGTGRALPPKYEGLRGGSQLQRVGDDAWLGIAHEMKYVSGLKMYWHIFYLVDSRGKMKATSPSCKLAPEGIEFAAGLVIDGDRLVVSFGVDDMHCRLGETKLDAVMGTLRAVEP